MQETSELYKQIVSEEDHGFETALSIGDDGRLITQSGETITFGGVAILVDTGGPETAFQEDVLWDVSTTHRAFSQDLPEAGGALSGEINVKMLKPIAEIPKRARLAPYIRAISSDGERVSEWLQKGVFFVYTRDETHDDDGLDLITLHGYDAMLLFEQNYPSDSAHDYPMLDVDMVSFIAGAAGITVDPRTLQIMQHGYMLPLPAGYSQREVLGIIAACYGGNFVISDQGELLLITIGGIPKETNYLIDQTGDSIVFGADLHYEATESGGVVTFNSPAEITALSVAVEPVQAGSGEPSPDNVRPISGWDAVGIGNSGQNLIDIETAVNGYLNASTGAVYDNQNWQVTGFIPARGGDYTLSWESTATLFQGTICAYDQDQHYITGVNWSGGAYSHTFTLPFGTSYIRAAWSVMVSGSPAPRNNIRLNFGSADLGYTPFASGNTYAITLGQTVYGGTLDAVNGTLTVDRAVHTFDGTEVFGGDGAANAVVPRWNYFVAGPIYTGYGISNMLKRADSYVSIRNTPFSMSIGAGYRILLNPEGKTYANINAAAKAIAAWCTDMYNAGTPLQVCYGLATPIEITLTPTQIATISGQTNNVWSDAGDVTVTYKVETEAVRILV